MDSSTVCQRIVWRAGVVSLLSVSCWLIISGCDRPLPPRAGNPVAGSPASTPRAAAALVPGGTWKVGGTWQITPPTFPPVSFHFAEIMGAGCALFDYDGDGDLDIYLIYGAGASPFVNPAAKPAGNRLLRQTEPGKFEDASAGSGLDVSSLGMGVAIGDVNNDGWPDVFLANYGPDHLLLNQRNGKFADVSAQAGFSDFNWGSSACFLDFDRDGWLDLCVVNYLDYDASHPCVDAEGEPDFCNPKLFAGVAARLYRNVSGATSNPGNPPKTVKFQDVSWESGIGTLKGPGLGVVSGDFNGDRWPDLFIANDGAANYLWMNQQNGTFAEEAVLRSGAYDNQGRPQANMGIALGDPDRDGDADLVVTHLRGENNSYYVTDRQIGFSEESSAAGLAAPSISFTGFGTAFFDFELDGDLDLAVVNGDVRRSRLGTYRKSKLISVSDFWMLYAQRNQSFVNDGQGQFAEATSFSTELNVARGLATGDIDNDGDIDLLVSSADGTCRLYVNETVRRGHWLMVRAVDPALGGRDAYGAQVTVTANKQSWTSWVNAGGSYLAASDPRVHFGIGDVDSITQIRVIWPNGDEEVFAGGAVDRQVTVSHGQGKKP